MVAANYSIIHASFLNSAALNVVRLAAAETASIIRRGAHDDVANCVAGVIVMTSRVAAQEVPFCVPIIITRPRNIPGLRASCHSLSVAHAFYTARALPNLEPLRPPLLQDQALTKACHRDRRPFRPLKTLDVLIQINSVQYRTCLLIPLSSL